MWLKSKWFIFPLLISIIFYFIQTHNTCRSYTGYFYPMFSPDCYHNPDSNDGLFGIIQKHIGISELHQVETEDGYILGVFRIPRKNPKGVVLLEHPITHDSRIWVAQQNQSIAFLVWRAGYDVWLCNNRGTFYSRKHKTFEIDSPSFWNYSLHELGYYDSSAVVEYIASKTKSKIIVLGYSLGATKTLIYASTRLESTKLVKISIIIAPGSHFNRATSIITTIVSTFFKLQNLFNFIQMESSVARTGSCYVALIKTISRIFPFKKVLIYFSSVLFGWTPDEFDPMFANDCIEDLTFDVSFKVYHHYSQIFWFGGSFQMYDFGNATNLAVYGQGIPPLYPVPNIQYPTFVVYGEEDSLSHPEDNDVLYRSLSKEGRRFGKLRVKGFNHLDFIYGKRRHGLYKNILKLLERV